MGLSAFNKMRINQEHIKKLLEETSSGIQQAAESGKTVLETATATTTAKTDTSPTFPQNPKPKKA